MSGLNQSFPDSKTIFEWVCLEDLPSDAPIYMSRAYQLLLASQDGSEARLLLCRSGNQRAWLPLLVRDLGHGMREAYSAYGYGGFFGQLRLARGDTNRLSAYLADLNIIALFLRHSPFLSNQSTLPQEFTRLNRATYAVELSELNTFTNYVAQLTPKLKWSANFALRAGLKIEFYPLSECSRDKMLAFYDKYLTLIKAKGIKGYYRFSESFFLDHAVRLGKDCELAELTDNTGKPLGGALFLLGADRWAHYHLSAACSKAMSLQGMELLLLSAIHRYSKQGLIALHLGGGHLLNESDGLSRFKSKFSNRKLEFHCSTIICDGDAYERERKRLPLTRPEFFLISDARSILT